LTSVRIPEGAVSIGGQAFRGCKKLDAATRGVLVNHGYTGPF
jgi:hypothetical protein